MAENVEKNGDNINSLCKKYFTPELRAGLSRKDERTLQLKLIRQMEAFANDLWKKSNYKKLNLPKNEKNDVVTKVEAKDSAIALCFSSWKKNPLQNTNGYAKFFETTFINELHKFVDEDLKNFTYVPEKVTENDRLLCDKCKSRGIANDDLSGQKKIAHEIGLSDDEYEAVRKWRLSKNPGSLEIPIGENEKGELIDNVEDEKTQSPDNKYIEIETGKRIVEFINKIFRMKKRDDWWKSLVTGIFYDLLHRYFALSNDSLDRYVFVDKSIYDLSSKPSQKGIANILGKDEGQLSRATDKFLALCMENMSDFQAFKDDYELQESLKKYLKDIQDKGKHKKRGEQ